MSEIRVGISGWTYPNWKKVFYPAKLSASKEMEYATSRMGTIEVNGTFYRLQQPSTFRDWYVRSPKNFVFSVKGNNFVTHIKRLRDVEGAAANFYASGLTELREKLGPVLWQLPTGLKFDEGRMREFLEILPKTSRQAIALAKTHDKELKGAKGLRAYANARIRHAIEVRDDSFKDRKFLKMLRDHDVAYVIADTAGRWYNAEEVTADFVYIRLHGFKELYTGAYPEAAIRSWARKIKKWNADGKRDVFAYFDTDYKVNAPFDAANLMLHLRKHPDLVMPQEDPRELFERRTQFGRKTMTQLQDRAKNR